MAQPAISSNHDSRNRQGAGLALSPPASAGADPRIYFRKLRLRLKIGLFLAFLTPLAALSLYFHFQFNSTLKESGKLHLNSLAESQRNTVELFLQERVVNIFSLFHESRFSLSPTEADMLQSLNSLRSVSDAFVDVGFFDPQGVQVGYAGPFASLYGKDYSNEKWFKVLIAQERNYYISDIYTGFRNKPHFTIAVKQMIDSKPYVIRATLDPDKFYLFLRNISRGKGVDSCLINLEGVYQVVDPDKDQVLDKGDLIPPSIHGNGVYEVESRGGSVLVAYAWLNEAPWALVVSQPFAMAYADMYRARKYMIAGTSALILAISAAVWLITDRLLKKAETTAEARQELQSQLLHVSKLASVGELAAGVAHEINNPLAIISAENGLIRDMLDPQFKMEWTPDTIRAELDHIDTAVFRARGIIQKLLNFARKNSPTLMPTNVNEVLDEVVGGLKEREFQVEDVTLVRNYDMDIPEIMLDPDQIGQVFLNIINNAGDAINGPGTITLTTRRDDGAVKVGITDTGSGMSSEQMEKIFLPFYTTKEVGHGTGLGLSVSLSIVESMGGRIEVQSMPGAGSSFTVVLPITGPGEVKND